ncbi:MAG TPA: hypothetical protein VKB37_16960 [Jatrophihabitantaceae bacterium]|nr:hypothetical protein [Jatrophihabitantaceae bacterium]
MTRRRKQFSPFVDQAELIDRMRADLLQIRSGLRVRVRTREDDIAIDQLDQWISSALAELRSSKPRVEDLQLLALEWQLRRARYLDPDAADVIVVDP